MTTPEDPPTRASRRAAAAADDTFDDDASGVRSPASRRRRRIIAWSVVGAVLIVIAGVAVVGLRLYDRASSIRAELVAAQALVPTVTSSAASLDFTTAGAAIDEAASHTARAIELADDPLWQAAASVPWLGKNVTAVNEITVITDDALAAARPLVAAAPTLLPANFAPVDGAVPIQPLLDAQPVVHTAAAQVADIDARLQAVDVDGTIDAIASAKTSLASGLEKVLAMLGPADRALTVAPKMLGADGPQTYVVMFLNNAELRSLGGTALSFAEVKVDAGRIELVQAIPAGFGNFAITGTSIVPVPEGFEQIAPGGFGTFITNAGIRPSIGSAADVVSANWQKEFGRTPDAVVSMDVVALSYLLRATGPVETSRWTIDSTNAVDVLLNQVLNAFDSGNLERDNAQQDLVYAQLVDQTFARVSAGQFDIAAMMGAIGQGVTERRILTWSADESIEELLVEAGLGPDVPDRAGDASIAAFYLNENVGSKLNYYLDTAVQVDQLCAAADTHRVSLTLHSTLDPRAVDDLNPAVLGQYKREDTEPGDQRLYVYGYAPAGAAITAAAVDGAGVEPSGFADAGHAVQVWWVTVSPGQSVTLTFDVTVAGDVVAMVTPTVRPTQVAAAPAACSG